MWATLLFHQGVYCPLEEIEKYIILNTKTEISIGYIEQTGNSISPYRASGAREKFLNETLSEIYWHNQRKLMHWVSAVCFYLYNKPLSI